MHILSSKRIRLCFLVIILLMSLIMVNRVLCGTWNPLSMPERIVYCGRIYNMKSEYNFDKKQVVYPLYSINWLTGKFLYTDNPRKGWNVPTVIYLHINDNKYRSYVLSGGP